MEEQDGWKQFAATGKVMDYLEYKGCVDRAANLANLIPGQETAGNGLLVAEGERRMKELKKEAEHEGNSDTARDGSNNVYHERLR